MNDYLQAEEDVAAAPEFLSGGGELGSIIRAYDWASTPLGPVDTWPQSLRTCIRIMLTSRQPIWIGWGKELIKFYNDPYKAIVGGKHPWALGKPASVVWREIWNDIGPMLSQVMEMDEGTYVESQLLIMERNGYPEETYYTFSYTPIPGDDGKTEGMFCANTDDTDKIISERQLTTLTLLGKRLADCRTEGEIIDETIATLRKNPHDFPFALFRTITDGKALLAHATPLGVSARNISKEIDLSSGDEAAQMIIKAIATRKPQVFEGLNEKFGEMPKGAWEIAPDKLIVLPIIQTGTNEPYGILIVGLNPYRLLNEKYLGFFSLITDQIATAFSDVHILEEERKRAEALAEIDRAKTTFFSNISHEFRTPLTLMLAPIEDALNDAQTIPENRHRMQVAYHNVQRLLKLVNTLLDFSRIEAGRMQASYERINLCEVTKDLASIFRSAIEKAGMELLIDCDEVVEAYVDMDMWEKIVLNLLSNAFKYTHNGRITVSLKRNGDTAVFSVADTGIGIPEEQLDKVFERFHRIQNTGGRSQEGTGIGLALVHELVKLHHGAIHVESKPGSGTTFSITMPLGRAHLVPDQIVFDKTATAISSKADAFLGEALKWLPSEAAEKDHTLPDLNDADIAASQKTIGEKRPRILLADDNTDMRDYLGRLLGTAYDVTTVRNGKLALKAAQELSPDLILSDVMMPEMNGFELVRHLKELPQTRLTPIILLSARAGEEATIEGLQTGADDYLVKPFSARELLSRVDSNIRIAKSRIHAARQLYNLFMHAPVPIAILRGREQRFELANEGYLEIAGRTSVVGKTLLEAFPEFRQNDSGVLAILDEVFTTGVPFHGSEFEVPLVRNGKTELVYFNFVYSPLHEMDGAISGVMVVATDVTNMVQARKALQQNEARLEGEVQARTEELRRINESLERSNKELEQYAFVTSHDLQEPLRKIQTFAQLLYRVNKDKLDETSVHYYERVVDSARRMSSLIKDLLEFSRLTQREQFAPTDLNIILADVRQDFELIIQQKEATVDTSPIPVVEAIPLQMNQLFTNLLGNALKFAAPGRRPLIKVSSRMLPKEEVEQYPPLAKGEEHIEISVSDNGIGFEPAYREKIFEIFQRLHSHDTYAGTGIGLALCARIVTNHGGVIVAEGEQGAGATFKIILPTKQKEALA